MKIDFKFKVGDFVQHKSIVEALYLNNPRMMITTKYFSEDSAGGKIGYQCDWFANGAGNRSIFSELELVKYPEKKKSNEERAKR